MRCLLLDVWMPLRTSEAHLNGRALKMLVSLAQCTVCKTGGHCSVTSSTTVWNVSGGERAAPVASLIRAKAAVRPSRRLTTAATPPPAAPSSEAFPAALLLPAGPAAAAQLGRLGACLGAQPLWRSSLSSLLVDCARSATSRPLCSSCQQADSETAQALFHPACCNSEGCSRLHWLIPCRRCKAMMKAL